MTRDAFILILETNNLKPGSNDDLNKLLDDFSKIPTNSSIEEVKEQSPTQWIFKDTIWRYINIYNPSYFNPKAAQGVDQARDTLSDEWVKFIRPYLKSISDYLKKERIDNMSFFAMLDVNKDGVVSEKEFIDGLSNFRIKNLDSNKIIQIF